MRWKKIKNNHLWLLGFEPRSPRPQRGILTPSEKWTSHIIIHRHCQVSTQGTGAVGYGGLLH